MKVLDKLASSLGQRDDVPNQDLAKQIAQHKDLSAVQELVDNLGNRDKAIQSDCIKTLYEIGYIEPGLLTEYAGVFLGLLDSKNNRLQWGTMIALHTITPLIPDVVYANLDSIMAAANKGSVITRDGAVMCLIGLCGFEQFAEQAFALLIAQLKTCPTNQLPMYAERAMHCVNTGNRAVFVDTLKLRLDEIDKDSKRKRLLKVIEKLS